MLKWLIPFEWVLFVENNFYTYEEDFLYNSNRIGIYYRLCVAKETGCEKGYE